MAGNVCACEINLTRELALSNLPAAEKEQCHGFESTVGHATTGNKDTRRTWTRLLFFVQLRRQSSRCKSYYNDKSSLGRTRLQLTVG